MQSQPHTHIRTPASVKPGLTIALAGVTTLVWGDRRLYARVFAPLYMWSYLYRANVADHRLSCTEEIGIVLQYADECHVRFRGVMVELSASCLLVHVIECSDSYLSFHYQFFNSTSNTTFRKYTPQLSFLGLWRTICTVFQ